MFLADLQIHSCLSPCGSLDSSPRNIAFAAKEKGLDIIALTDHNTADNCPAFHDVVKQIPNLTAYFGAEVTSAEEVHLICLFGNVDTAVDFGNFVKSHLHYRENEPEHFGFQPIVDAEDNIIDFEKTFLVGSTDLSIDKITDSVHSRQGLVIASHVDRALFGLFENLGIWPEDANIDAADLSPRAVNETKWRALIPENVPIIRTSDAHYLDDIGRQFTAVDMKDSDFESFKNALSQMRVNPKICLI